MLADLGGVSIDADALVREVTAPGQPALVAVRDRFGAAVFEPSGVIDRAALASLVFADAAALRDLEAIVHPAVRTLIEERLREAVRDDVPFVVIEAIKLVEGGLAERCHEVWLIDCEPAQQRERLARRGMDAADVERRLAVQGPDLAERLAPHAQRRIDTSGSSNQSASASRTRSRSCLHPGSPGSRGDPWSAVRALATSTGPHDDGTLRARRGERGGREVWLGREGASGRRWAARR